MGNRFEKQTPKHIKSYICLLILQDNDSMADEETTHIKQCWKKSSAFGDQVCDMLSWLLYEAAEAQPVS